MKIITKTLFLSAIAYCICLFFIQNKQDKTYTKTPKTDGANETMLLEVEKTIDPSLGVVPKERLVKAYEYQQKLLETKAAISGITWAERGPNNIGGRVRAILYDKNDLFSKTVWVASVGGGLWKTTDITAATTSWTNTNNFFANLAVTTIAQCASTPALMAFGTGEGFYNADAIRGNGVWVSTNKGLNWAQLTSTNNSFFYYIQKIVITNSKTLLVATRDAGVQRFIWNSVTNTWNTPTKVLANGIGGGNHNAAADIEIGADGKIYASLGIFGVGGVFRSADDGLTWTKIYTPSSTEYRIELAPAPSDANYLYMAIHNSSTTVGVLVKKTINATASTVSWTNITPAAVWKDYCSTAKSDFTRNQAWYNLICVVSPANKNIVYLGGIDVLRTTNGGSSWTQISEWINCSTLGEMHADQHAMAFQPNLPATMLFGNDGGVYRSINAAETVPVYTHRNTGLNITQYYACAANPTAGSHQFLAGAQDNGTHKFSISGINPVSYASGGDGGFCHIDQNQSVYAFTSHSYNNFYRSITGLNGTFSPVIVNNTGRFINPSDYDDVNNIMYSAGNTNTYYVWTNPQTGSTFTNITATSFAGQVSAIKVANNTIGTNTVLMATSLGRVYRVKNAHTTAPAVTNISTGLPIGYINCIDIDPNNANHLVVVYSNYGVNSVWRTLDGGLSWTSIEGNLPDMPIRWALFRPKTSGNATQMLLATELGVWSTDFINGTATVWGVSNTGMANVRVDMLNYRKADGVIMAATHGRGLYTSGSVMPNLISQTNDKMPLVNDAIEQPTSPTTNTPTISEPFKVNIYPNPCINELTISIEKYPATIQVFNTKGEEMKTALLNSSQDILYLNDIPTGIYMIHVKLDNQFFTKTIFKL